MAIDPEEQRLRQELESAAAAGNSGREAAATAHFALAALLRKGGEKREALNHLTASARLWQALGSLANLQASLNNAVAVATDLEVFPEAMRAAQLALKIADQMNDPGRRAMALTTLGAVASNAGDLDTARDSYEQSEALARQANDPVRVARALYNRSWIAFLAGDYDLARRHCTAAASALGALVDPPIQGFVTMMGGCLDTREQRFDLARRRLRWSADTFARIDDTEDAGLARFAHGCADYLAGDVEPGKRDIEASLGAITKRRNAQHTAVRLCGLGRIAANRGDEADQAWFAGLAADIAGRIGDSAVMGMVARLRGEPSQLAESAEWAIHSAVVQLDAGAGAPPEPAGEAAADPGSPAADLKWLDAHQHGGT